MIATSLTFSMTTKTIMSDPATTAAVEELGIEIMF
jgi:hypothetical protein